MPYRICQYQPCSKSFYVKPSRLQSRQNRYHSKECQRLAVVHRTEKTCPQCGITKLLDQFHVCRERPDGRQPICKECISGRDKKDRRARGLKLPDHPHLTIDPDTGRFISVMPLIDRFWSYVDRSAGPDACWPWTGATDDKGYGTISIRREDDIPHGLPKHEHSTSYLATRVAFAIMIGHIPNGMDILHTCDNPICTNAYKHLYPGTDLDNAADRQSHGRNSFGERNVNAKLTDALAKEIFALKEQYSSLTVAPWFGVHSGTILNIWNKRTWKHIHDKNN